MNKSNDVVMLPMVMMMVAVVGVIAFGSVLSSKAHAQTPVRWNSACYNTFDSMVTAANRLNTKDVQFFSIPSERNYAGILGNPYCLLYSR